MKLIATDRAGVEHVVNGRDGWTMMEALRDADLSNAAECGGSRTCATCHVYFDDAWFDRLAPAFESTSPLSCQIICGPHMDGIKVTVAPEWAFNRRRSHTSTGR